MRESVKIMGIPMNPWTMDETVDEISKRLKNKSFTQHVVMNAGKFVKLKKDLSLRKAILACNIINIDGMGVVWAARFLGFDVPERVAGIDLFIRLLEFASKENEPVFFVGSRPDVIEKAVEKIRETFPNLKIAGSHHGYYEDYEEEELVDAISSSGASLLFIAMTSPKKEEFINKWQKRLGVGFVMGIGGTLDIMAGITNRAPTWMQNIGLEWFFRLIQEPQRMWKRYLVGNTLFLYYILMEKLNNFVRAL